MTLEESLYTYLVGYAGLVALVSDRTYHMRTPQDPTYPLVNINWLPKRNVEAMGSSNLGVATVQATAFSDVSPDEAGLVAAQIYAALHRFPEGVMGGGVTVVSSLFEDEEADYEDQLGIFSMTHRYEVHYRK